jgi:phosphoribosylformimino-5-aminoimidazole carboxamide ribotide isomerase
MIIFPAIDLKDGKCVRLIQGDYNQKQVFSDDPVEVAMKWQAQGGQYLHLVDLGAALTGIPENKKTIEQIVQALDIPVQVGGGIRDMGYAEELMDLGVARVILGTSALIDLEFTKAILKKHHQRIAVSIDAKNGFVAIKGWTEVSSIKAADLANQLKAYGLETIVYTDIAMDGMMKGPNFKELESMQQETGLKIIASGGVSTGADIERLRRMDLYGAIVGKALYTGAIDLAGIQKGAV